VISHHKCGTELSASEQDDDLAIRVEIDPAQ